MSEQNVTVTLESGDYSAVQQTGFVIEKDGLFMRRTLLGGRDGARHEFVAIEYATFFDSYDEAVQIIKSSMGVSKSAGGKVRTAKRLIVDFYEVCE